jgi:hypothetical protein
MKTAFTLLALTFVLGACSAEPPAAKPAAKALPYAPPPPALLDEGVACAQDVRLCADGSTVSRTGTACTFAACPGASPK